MDYGIRWEQFNRKGELVGMEKFFATGAKRDAYLNRLRSRPAFQSLVAYTDPRSQGK